MTRVPPDAMAKPLGSLGRLGALAVQLTTTQGALTPVVRDPVVLVFVGNHGAASAVSAYPEVGRSGRGRDNGAQQRPNQLTLPP